MAAKYFAGMHTFYLALAKAELYFPRHRSARRIIYESIISVRGR